MRTGQTGFRSIMNPEDFAMTLSRRDFSLGTALGTATLALGAGRALAQSTLSTADQALVTQAQTYLRGLTTAQGDFVETGPGGQRRTGRFWLRRPGRMRFEYSQPEGLLVVSDGNNVMRWDPRLEVFRQVPLRETPLSTFLSRDVRLDQGVRIDRVIRRDGGGFAIVARDSRRPNEGAVTLNFGGDPMRLTEWTIEDAQGTRTRTQLTSLRAGGNPANSLFELRDPTRRPGRNR